MSLVAGYESDSDEESNNATSTARNAIDKANVEKAEERVAPHHLDSSLSTSKRDGKRKAERLQIRVQGNVNEEEPAEDKRPKFSGSRLGGAGTSRQHGLFSLLPAPTHALSEYAKKAIPVEATSFGVSNVLGADKKLTLVEDVADKDAQQRPKANADFRAMLGLGPSKNVETKKTTGRPAQERDSTISRTSATATRVEPSREDAQDIFSLPVKVGTSTASTSVIARLPAVVSAAPVVSQETAAMPEEEEVGTSSAQEVYRGWQQGSDGSWFPVTPEAHAQYAAHLSAVSQRETLERQAMESKGFDTDQAKHSSKAVDVNEREADASTVLEQSALDKKYALAAASLATQGVRVDLSGLDEDDDQAADKSKNLRAKRKGQLSSLIAQADESKEKLEERWSRGRAARVEAQKRYGF